MITIFHFIAFSGAVLGLVTGIVIGAKFYGWIGGAVGAVVGAYIGLVLGRLPRLIAVLFLRRSSKNTRPTDPTNTNTPR